VSNDERWIPVTERLPERVDTGDDMNEAESFSANLYLCVWRGRRNGLSFVDTGYVSEEGRVEQVGEGYWWMSDNYHATHWMPRPAPPNTGELKWTNGNPN
jgi:hypothetical protein